MTQERINEIISYIGSATPPLMTEEEMDYISWIHFKIPMSSYGGIIIKIKNN